VPVYRLPTVLCISLTHLCLYAFLTSALDEGELVGRPEFLRPEKGHRYPLNTRPDGCQNESEVFKGNTIYCLPIYFEVYLPEKMTPNERILKNNDLLQKWKAA